MSAPAAPGLGPPSHPGLGSPLRCSLQVWRQRAPRPSSDVSRSADHPRRHLPALLVLRGIPFLSKHRADRVKRLGDFLNMESFDLVLLEEVGPGGTIVEPWPEGAAGGASGSFSPGKGRASILTPFLRCGVSRISST